MERPVSGSALENELLISHMGPEVQQHMEDLQPRAPSQDSAVLEKVKVRAVAAMPSLQTDTSGAGLHRQTVRMQEL
jgi:hypothetical protein